MRKWFVAVSIFFVANACLVPAGAQVSSTYTIGVSDVLEIEIRNLGTQEYSLRARVPPSGVISIPLLDEITVTDTSISELQSLIESRLRDGYLKGPEVTITIAEFRPFFINGAVNDPGAFPYQSGLTVEKAVALAGGLTDSASLEKITIKRNTDQGDEVRTVGLAEKVNPGDVIDVDEILKEHVGKFVYLYGEVRNPGSYPFRDDLTIEKAIVLAGGFTERASKKKISIRRGEDEPYDLIRRPKLYMEVEPGDVITIGQSFF